MNVFDSILERSKDGMVRQEITAETGLVRINNNIYIFDEYTVSIYTDLSKVQKREDGTYELYYILSSNTIPESYYGYHRAVRDLDQKTLTKEAVEIYRANTCENDWIENLLK